MTRQNKRAPRPASSYRAARRNAALRPDVEPATTWGERFYSIAHSARYGWMRHAAVRPNQRDQRVRP